MLTMDAATLIASLERFGTTLRGTVQDISSKDARWKPPDGAWSILEIIMHLCDEEVEDFRQRLDLTLRDPAAAWPGIDPPGWAVQRRYNEGDLRDAVDRFVRVRESSISWLRSLRNPDWSKTHRHPKLGAIRAGDLLAAWAAHDPLHLRQIAKRMHQLAQRNAGEYSVRYAGEWGP